MVETLQIPYQLLANAVLDVVLLLAGTVVGWLEYRAVTSPRVLGYGWAFIVTHFAVVLVAIHLTVGVTLASVAAGYTAAFMGLIGRDVAHRWEVDIERARIAHLAGSNDEQRA